MKPTNTIPSLQPQQASALVIQISSELLNKQNKSNKDLISRPASINYSINRRYSIDDNGGGYMGL